MQISAVTNKCLTLKYEYLLEFNAEQAETYAIPYGVTKIDTRAFRDCPK